MNPRKTYYITIIMLPLIVIAFTFLLHYLGTIPSSLLSKLLSYLLTVLMGSFVMLWFVNITAFIEIDNELSSYLYSGILTEADGLPQGTEVHYSYAKTAPKRTQIDDVIVFDFGNGRVMFTDLTNLKTTKGAVIKVYGPRSKNMNKI